MDTRHQKRSHEFDRCSRRPSLVRQALAHEEIAVEFVYASGQAEYSEAIATAARRAHPGRKRGRPGFHVFLYVAHDGRGGNGPVKDSTPEKIPVTDDNRAALKAAGRMLDQASYEVTPAADGLC